MDLSEQEFSLTMSTESMCAFCLRASLPNVDFYKYVRGSFVEQFQSILGCDFLLENFAICKPCWKLMQLLQDFRSHCLKANSLVERIGQGLRSEGDKYWFSEETLAAIEGIGVVVQDQLQQIERIDVAEEVPIKAEPQDIPEETLVSTIEIGHTKIEPIDDTILESDELVSNHVESAKEMDVSSGEESAVDNSSRELTCKKCGRLFRCARGLHRHLAACDEQQVPPYPCPVCHVEFSRRHALNTHMLIHKYGESPFKCRKFCNKVYTTSRELGKHERKCVMDVQQCTICSEQLANKSCLSEHYQLVHPGERRVKCSKCGVRFKKLYLLKAHELRIHSDRPKTLPCDVCGRLFAMKDDLLRHEMIHATEFKCEFCGSEHRSSYALRMHKGSAHVEEFKMQRTKKMLLKRESNSANKKGRADVELPGGDSLDA